MVDANTLKSVPNKDPLSPKIMFVCTYMAKLSEKLPEGSNTTSSFTDLIKNNLNSDIVAVNSNYGHGATKGFEKHIRAPRRYLAGRARKMQGDGSCFNHSVDTSIKIDKDFAAEKGISADKVYVVKCFPSTGTLHLPGVVAMDISDGPAILDKYIAFINGLLKTDIKVVDKEIKMINYKCHLQVTLPSTAGEGREARAASTRPIYDEAMVVKRRELNRFLNKVEESYASEKAKEGLNEYLIEMGFWTYLPPPFRIKEVKSALNEVKISFKFECKNSKPRVTIFDSGKITIAGGKDIAEIDLVYMYLKATFQLWWNYFIVPLAKPDAPLSPPDGPPAGKAGKA